MSLLMFCVGGGSLGLQRCLSTSSSNHSLVTGCLMELHTPVRRVRNETCYLIVLLE